MDRQTFDQLLLDLLPAAQRFAIRLTNDPESAEDLLHDALVRAASSWRGFRGESSFRTWFFQIVINVWRDRLRLRYHPMDMPEELLDPRSIEPSQRARSEELKRLIASHVSSLPPRQREVLVLVAFEEMSPWEAAVVLGISEQNARVNLHHARKRLKQLLAPYLDESRNESTTRSNPAE